MISLVNSLTVILSLAMAGDSSDSKIAVALL